MDNMVVIDDESLDAVGRGIDDAEGYFSVGSGEEDEVEVNRGYQKYVDMSLSIHMLPLKGSYSTFKY